VKTLNFEMNKAFMAILIAVLYFILSGMFTDSVFTEHKLAKNSYPIEVANASTGSVAEAAAVGPTLAELLQTADIASGQKAFKACATCHTVQSGGAAKTGPNLWNILGRDKASVAGFSYSAGMVAKGGDWSYDDLSEFLTKPKKFIAKTKMTFAGMKKIKKRANLIAYLRSLSDNPADLPAVEAKVEAPASEGQ
jgi:cytochrome c